MTRTHVRPAIQCDFDAVHRLIATLVGNLAIDRPRLQRVFQLNLSNPSVHYWVAVDKSLENNGEECVVGFVSLVLHRHLHHAALVGEIQELVVLPGYRGNGVGKRLLRLMEQIAEQSGAVHMELSSNKRRVEAHRFYTREGYDCSHVRFVKTIDAT